MKWEFFNKRVAVFVALIVTAACLVSWINALSPEDRIEHSGSILQKALASQSAARDVR